MISYKDFVMSTQEITTDRAKPKCFDRNCFSTVSFISNYSGQLSQYSD